MYDIHIICVCVYISLIIVEILIILEKSNETNLQHNLHGFCFFHFHL